MSRVIATPQAYMSMSRVIATPHLKSLYNKKRRQVVTLLDFIFPKRCVGCGKVGKYFCDACRLTIKVIKPNEAVCPVCEKPAIDGATHPRCQTRYTIDGLTSFFRYDGVIRKAIKAVKYRLVSDLAQEFIDFIPFSSINHQLLTINKVLVPIPLHSSRFRERGFNQAEVMGKLLATTLGIPIGNNFLKRTKNTTPQVAMKDRKKRLANMEHVFSVHPLAVNREPLTIFLFDDVFTTGATMRSAAGTLKRSGVHHVWGITMAR